MPRSASGAKASRKTRGKAALETGIDPDDVFIDMLKQWKAATGNKRFERGLALLPYIKPRLRAIDHSVQGSVSVTVNIGGDGAG